MSINRDELINLINKLPKGGITYKTINGKRYAYYQWTEGGKQKGRRVPDEELDDLAALIAERKNLQKQLREIKDVYTSFDNHGYGNYEYGSHAYGGHVYGSYAWENGNSYSLKENHQSRILTRIGDELIRFSEPAKSWKRREGFGRLKDFIHDEGEKVFILYGLRRTGKTTMIRQLISEMDTEELSKTAFLQITRQNNLGDVNSELRRLEQKGYRYVFIDEVTLMEDFISGAALLSDIFATSGMKIVLSGTDSLGFVFSEDEQLYDRCILLHTTFIPYKEFHNILGIEGLDTYIKHGGTMVKSGAKYNELPFSTMRATKEYVDSAIANNIQHSLRFYQNGGHFRHLQDLYDAGELTSAINRIVEDLNHKFTVEVLTREFKSGDLSLSASNLRRDRNAPNDVLDRIDRKKVTKRLKEFLSIKNKSEQSVAITDLHALEIKEYLELLDLIIDIDVIDINSFGEPRKRTTIVQPGIRYSQAEALIKSLITDEAFRELSLTERNSVVKRMLSEVRGRMLEDIVLLETKLANKNAEVFKLEFSVGEFDMVVSYPDENRCEIFEIKHSSEIVKDQTRHLRDKKKCRDTEFRFGEIKGKYVLYTGDSKEVEGIKYLNVGEYLDSI